MDSQPTGGRQGIVARLTWGRIEARRRTALGDRITAAVGRDVSYLLERLERRTLSAAQIETVWSELEEDVAELIAASEEQRTAVKASAADLLLLTMSLYNLDAVLDQLNVNLTTYDDLLGQTNPRLPAIAAPESEVEVDGVMTSAPPTTMRLSGAPASSVSAPPASPRDATSADLTPSSPTGLGRRAPRTQPRVTAESLSQMARELERVYTDLARVASRIQTTLRSARTPSRFVLRGAIEQFIVLMSWLKEAREEIGQRYLTPVRVVLPVADLWSRVLIGVGAGCCLLAFFVLPWLYVGTPGTASDPITPLGLLLDHAYLALSVIQTGVTIASGAGVLLTLAFRTGRIAFGWKLESVITAVRYARNLTRVASSVGLILTLALLSSVQAVTQIRWPFYANLAAWGTLLTLLGFTLVFVGGTRPWYFTPSQTASAG